MKRILLNTIVLLSVSVFSFAQTINEAQLAFLETVYEHYAEANSFSMQVEVSAFDKNQNLVMPVQQNRSVKSEEQYLIETPAVINMITEEFQLVVDHGNQIIQLNPLIKESKGGLEHGGLEQAFPSREILERDTTITVSETEELLELITIEPLSLNKNVYTFQKATKTLQQVDYYTPTKRHGQPTHVQVRYFNVIINKEIPFGTFALTKYLTRADDELKPAEEFEHYTFIDNTIAK